MKVTKITVGRLYNLGSYEHVRYELTVEIPPGESATDAIIGVERILEGMKPESKSCIHSQTELERESRHISALHELLSNEGSDEFRNRNGYFKGTPEEYIARCEQIYQENLTKRTAWDARAKKARELFDNIGGASEWKDAKLDWENDYNDSF